MIVSHQRPSITSTPQVLPHLPPVHEDLDSISNVDDANDAGSVTAASNIGSVSQVSDTKGSLLSHQSKPFSAFSAPPRYRNSGAFVHGTKFRNFSPIMEQGLKAAKSEIYMVGDVRPDGRVPGLKQAPEILIFIDEDKARREHMHFEYDAAQGTWKTRGIDGVIRPWFFQKVIDQRRGRGRGNVLFQSKEDPLMQAAKLSGPVRPRFLLHATYWENVASILEEGIVPAKNPLSDIRRPFKDLLQGAESHVYTMRSTDLGCPETRVPKETEEPKLLVDKDQVGLDRQPDAIFVIDTSKAEKMGIDLELVQSGDDREDNIYVRGRVPPAILTAQPNIPRNLPDTLKAKIVDPKSFEEVPIIDLSLDEAEIIKKLKFACEVVGFMQVTGHGISLEMQEKALELQQQFFALETEKKDCLRLDSKSPVRGYFGRGGEDLDQVLEKQVDEANGKDCIQKSRKDCKEALDMNGVPWAKPKGGYIGEIFGQQSRLPNEDDVPGFREVMERYSAEMFKLSKRLLELMALILGKPRNFFDQYLDQPVATHRLLHYWPIKDFRSEIGVGEHTDYGLLTILKQDMVGGLQVLNAKDGVWVHCCPVENAFVINLGDMIGRWTAHRFKSTVHRVVTTSDKDRYSVPFFLEPNLDAVIEYGGLCSGPGSCSQSKFDPPSREEDTAGMILERFYRASGQLRTPAGDTK